MGVPEKTQKPSPWIRATDTYSSGTLIFPNFVLSVTLTWNLNLKSVQCLKITSALKKHMFLMYLIKSDSMGNLLCQMSPGSGVLSSIRLSYTKDVPHGRDAGLEIKLRWLSQEGLEDQKKKCDGMQFTKHLLLLHQATVCLLYSGSFSPCFNFETISTNKIFSQNECISYRKHQKKKEKRKFGLL